MKLVNDFVKIISMKISLKVLGIFLAILVLAPLGASAKDKLRIGKKKFKVLTETLNTASVIGNSATVSIVGNKGFGTASVNLIFQALADQMVEGAEFEVITGAGGEDGKVFLTYTNNTTKRNGKTKLSASDSDSSISAGSVRITKANDNGVTIKFKANVENTLVRKSDPLAGDITGTDSRSNKPVKISGQVTTSLQEQF